MFKSYVCVTVALILHTIGVFTYICVCVCVYVYVCECVFYVAKYPGFYFINWTENIFSCRKEFTEYVKGPMQSKLNCAL